MNAAIIAIRLIALTVAIGWLVIYTPAGRAFTDTLATLIGGTDTEGKS